MILLLSLSSTCKVINNKVKSQSFRYEPKWPLSPMPKPNGHNSRSSDDFYSTRDAFSLSLSISIFVNELFSFVQFQVPFSIPLCIDFPNHSGPPFICVQTDPTFDRLFNIQIHICKIAWWSTSILDKTFSPHPLYVFPFVLAHVPLLTAFPMTM